MLELGGANNGAFLKDLVVEGVTGTRFCEGFWGSFDLALGH